MHINGNERGKKTADISCNPRVSSQEKIQMNSALVIVFSVFYDTEKSLNHNRPICPTLYLEHI